MTRPDGGNDPGIYARPSGGAGSDGGGYDADDARSKYDIDDGYDKSDSWDKIQDQNHHQYRKGALKPGLRPAQDRAAEHQLDHQTDKLAGDYDMKRTPPGAGNQYYLGRSHEELYDAVNNKADPGDVHTVADSWTKIGNSMVEAPDDLAKAIAGSEAGWSGDSAEGARRAVAGIANKAGSIGKGAQLAGSLGAKQAEALSTARTKVPKPPEDPYTYEKKKAAVDAASSDQKESVAAKWEKKRTDEQDLHKQAATGVETYDNHSTQVARTQPAFAPAPKSTRSGGGDDSGSTGGYAGGGGSGGSGSIPHAGGAGGSGGGRGGAGGGAGRGGRGGMMPHGGKGGKGDDDYEHNSPSWLIEPDKDSLFGVDEKTAPPVIGDWWGQYDPHKRANSNEDGDDHVYLAKWGWRRADRAGGRRHGRGRELPQRRGQLRHPQHDPGSRRQTQERRRRTTRQAGRHHAGVRHDLSWPDDREHRKVSSVAAISDVGRY